MSITTINIGCRVCLLVPGKLVYICADHCTDALLIGMLRWAGCEVPTCSSTVSRLKLCKIAAR